MNQLTTRERELVSLGAALGSNCVPCIDHHIPEARKSGLTDGQIREAIELADAVRQVPARNVLVTAMQLMDQASGMKPDVPEASHCADISRGTARCC